MICIVIPTTLPHFSYTGFHIVRGSIVSYDLESLCASNLKLTTRAEEHKGLGNTIVPCGKSRLSPYWSFGDWGRGCKRGKEEQVKEIDSV